MFKLDLVYNHDRAYCFSFCRLHKESDGGTWSDARAWGKMHYAEQQMHGNGASLSIGVWEKGIAKRISDILYFRRQVLLIYARHKKEMVRHIFDCDDTWNSRDDDWSPTTMRTLVSHALVRFRTTFSLYSLWCLYVCNHVCHPISSFFCPTQWICPSHGAILFLQLRNSLQPSFHNNIFSDSQKR